jgi:hypothetical protein
VRVGASVAVGLTPPRRPLDRRGRPRRPRLHFRAGALPFSACGLRALGPRDLRPLRSLARLRAVQSPRGSRLPTPGLGDQVPGPAAARPPATDTALRHPLTELSICPVSPDVVQAHLGDLRRTTSAETPSSGLSHLIWSAKAILSAVSHLIWSREGHSLGGCPFASGGRRACCRGRPARR